MPKPTVITITIGEELSEERLKELLCEFTYVMDASLDKDPEMIAEHSSGTRVLENLELTAEQSEIVNYWTDNVKLLYLNGGGEY